MPIYEYQCEACRHHLEAMQKFSDSPLVECPACHKPALSKLVSATSFQLKGTGWYVTDIRDKGKKPASDAASTTDTSSTTTTETIKKDKTAE